MPGAGRDAQKRAAAEHAVALIEPGMRVGLGTGSTAWHVVDLLGQRLREGDLSDIVGVPTSRATEQQARSLNVPLATLDEVTSLDLCIDGADEVDPQIDLIKGLGGALLWEKIVARASTKLIIVADDSKDVDRLGTRSPLPVEVAPFGWRTHLAAMHEAAGRPALRTAADGTPFTTDGGHYIIDVHFERGIADAHALERALRGRAGIIETGLFLDMADTVVTATASGVNVRQRSKQ